MSSELKSFEGFENIGIGSTIFEPTLNPFPNGLLVNYKKVGTRFFSSLISLPNPFYYTENRIQLDFKITDNPIGWDINNPIHENFHKINFRFGNSYLYSEFDFVKYADYGNDLTGFDKFSSTQEFLKYSEVSNCNELLFENKKDIIFLIRNPIERFLSGLIQVIYHFTSEVTNDENVRNDLKYFTKFDDNRLKKIVKLLTNGEAKEEDFNQKNIDDVNLVISYILQHCWHYLFQDIHTQNYLRNYVEWIHHIKDKNKIKIINLKDCKSLNAKKFFNELRGDNLAEKHWNIVSLSQNSNKFIYDNFLKKIIISDDFDLLSNESFQHYISDEFNTYNSLIKSPYYVNLQD